MHVIAPLTRAHGLPPAAVSLSLAEQLQFGDAELNHDVLGDASLAASCWSALMPDSSTASEHSPVAPRVTTDVGLPPLTKRLTTMNIGGEGCGSVPTNPKDTEWVSERTAHGDPAVWTQLAEFTREPSVMSPSISAPRPMVVRDATSEPSLRTPPPARESSSVML